MSPTSTTTYSVRGSNAGGTGNAASATVVVTAAACTGGQVWNGSVCACPSGQFYVDGQCYAPAPATQCGVDRWPVKTGGDALAGAVVTTSAIPSAVAVMSAIAVPQPLPRETRAMPVETSVYVVDATLVKYRITEDSDYHLVLADSSGRTMIAELPHPDCVTATSPFKAAISGARAAFNTRLRATSTFKSTSIPVRVHGVGFFDTIHGQTGVAPNGIELHPVLKLELDPKQPQAADPMFPLASDTDRVFRWAENTYSSHFPLPSQQGSALIYSYRYYAKTGNYIGFGDGRAVVHNGRDWNLLDVGTLADFLTGAAGLGY